MTSRQPSLLRRLYPALALTGVGFGVVNVLDRPTPVGSIAAGDLNGGTVAADGSPSVTVITGDQATTTVPATGNSVASQGSPGTVSAPPVTQAPAVEAPATTVAPAAPAPATDDCGAIKKTGSAAPITHRRNYGTLVVTASFTSSGSLCAASATYDVYESKSNRYNDFAIPVLTQQAVAAGSANIQGVSGATATSVAYQQSLQSAIDQL